MIRDHGGFKFENEPTIVVAGNIRIAAGSMNCRIVLRKVKAGNSPSGFEYITHQENVKLDGDTWKHGDFYWGHYFMDDMEKAIADFNERCAKL